MIKHIWGVEIWRAHEPTTGTKLLKSSTNITLVGRSSEKQAIQFRGKANLSRVCVDRAPARTQDNAFLISRAGGERERENCYLD